MSQLIQIVKAVQIVEALDKTWKPKEHRQITFFGEFDLWLYVAVYDERLCKNCEAFAMMQVFKGTELQKNFPYLEITDEDKINVNVHPNCRCYLLRVISFERYERLLSKVEEREKGE